MDNIETTDSIFHKNGFLWVAFITGLLLLIPLIAMQFTAEVNWNIMDFIIMGLLLFCMGSLFVLVSRRTQRKYRLVIGTLFVIVLLYVWAELAVGVFTSLGN